MKTIAERFEEKVDRISGPVPPHRPELGRCHVWTAGKNGNGYGTFSIGGRAGRNQLAPRVAFLLEHGRWPEPNALHHCDNPACVKAAADADGPSHIFEGTQRDNGLDMSAKKRGGWVTHPERMPRGERNGKFTKPESTPRGDRNGSRLHPERLARGDKNGSRLYPERLAHGDKNWTRRHPERVLRADKNGMAKLTWELVKAIRAAVAAGESQTSVARRYGITQTNVSCIVLGKTWKVSK